MTIKKPKHPSDPKLQKAAEEIKAVLKRYDVGASITLVNGHGHAEYVNFMVAPDLTWSFLTVEQTPRGQTIRMRSRAVSAPPQERLMERVKAQRTVNACILLSEVLGHQQATYKHIVSVCEKHFDIEVGEGTHTPFSEVDHGE